ncbi:MAG TPA: PEGA domain-containing protein [Kofleriaceae bacterium]|nr:PEGA domain-containing protein [Kofleriaceae bacterium]
MVRLSLALVLAAVGVAGAETKRKVRIETTPPGATVYLVEKEAGPACEPTPCTVEAPVGSTPIIIELKDHGPVFDNLTVPRRGKVPAAKFTLEAAIGKIVVREPKGALVFVDEEEQGKAPLELDVSADAHHVVVKDGGKKVYDAYVEVTAGNETLISAEELGDDDEDDDEEDEVPDEDGGKVTKSASSGAPRAPLLRGTVAVDIGFRKFSYNAGSNQRPENEGGQILIGPLVEVWPGRLLGVPALRGISVLGRFQFGANQQAVIADDLGPSTATFWQSFEASLRQQFIIKNKVGLELGLGYVRDQLQFSGTAQDVAKLPDVTYSSVRIGLRASLPMGKVEPYVSFEPRFVLSGGKLEVRYDPGTKASGLRAGAGALFTFGRWVGRAEVSTTRYSWTFVTTDPEVMNTNSGSDAVIQIGLGAGYQY